MMKRLLNSAAVLAVLAALVMTSGCPNTVESGSVAVTGVTLDNTALTLTEGESGKLTATISPVNATNKAVTWSSNNSEVASVDANGTVRAHKAGQALITVKTQDGNKTAICTVTVIRKAVAVTGVTLDNTALTLTEGESGKLTATVAPVNATNKAVTWSSDNGKVASVDQEGRVTAQEAGEAKITVITQGGGKSASCTVTVVLPQYKIDFSTAGGKGNLTARLGGNIIDTGTMVEKGRTVIFTAEPSSGYKSVWEGVKAKDGTPNEAELTVTQPASIKVTFVPEGDYSITYNLNGGTNHTDNPASYTVETETISLQDAAKTGYTFAGWYDNAGFTGEKVTRIAKGSTGNKELWAKWEAVAYSITYNLNGGTNHRDNPASYTVEDIVTLQPATKEYYTFAGWYDNAGFTGEKVTHIAKGSTGDKELWAKWEAVSYSITYHFDGGTNHTDNPANYTAETETITLQDAAKTGYTFAGWYDNAGFTGEKVTHIVKGSSGNKELWAKFLENYSITYNLDGGTNHTDNPASYTAKDTVTLQPAAKANHTFAGWYDNAGFTGEKVTQIVKGSTGAKELWAKWELNKYSVNFTVNGGIGTLKASVNGEEATVQSPLTVTHGDTVTFTAEVTNAEYKIGNWTVDVGAFTSGGTFGNTTATLTITSAVTVNVSFFNPSAAGIIVLKDGTRVPTDGYTVFDPSKPPVAVLIGMKNAQGKSLGIGLHTGGSIWAKKDTTGYNTKFISIACKSNKPYGIWAHMTDPFTGDKDGSNNWEYICSIDPQGTANAAVNYPAFHWVNQYGTQYDTGTQKWYLPSIVEMCQVYNNCEKIDKSLAQIHSLDNNAAIAKLPVYYYWSSSQHDTSTHTYPTNDSAWLIDFGKEDNGRVYGMSKDYGGVVCCMAAF